MLEAVIVGFWITVGVAVTVGMVAVVVLIGRAGVALGRLVGDLINELLRWGYRRAGRGRCECGGRTYPSWLGGGHTPGRR